MKAVEETRKIKSSVGETCQEIRVRYISSSYPGKCTGTGNKIQFIIILLYIYCLKWLLLLIVGREIFVDGLNTYVNCRFAALLRVALLLFSLFFSFFFFFSSFYFFG